MLSIKNYTIIANGNIIVFQQDSYQRKLGKHFICHNDRFRKPRPDYVAHG